MDKFDPGFDLEIYDLLIRVCSAHKIDPSMSIESETYFRNLLDMHAETGNALSLEDFLHERINSDFIALDKRPLWIQGAEWPFDDNLQPMIFVGQIDISKSEGNVASQYFHDDTSYYVFKPKNKGKSKVIIQQF